MEDEPKTIVGQIKGVHNKFLSAFRKEYKHHGLLGPREKPVPTARKLISPRTALDLPAIMASDLNETEMKLLEPCKGKVTLLALWPTERAVRYGTQWIDVFARCYLHNSTVQIIQCSTYDSFVFKSKRIRAAVLRQSRTRFENQISPHIKNMVVWEDIHPQLIKAGLPSRGSAYLVLIDTVGRIRWTASGPPQDEDHETLYLLTQKLLEEERLPRRSKPPSLVTDLGEL